MVELSWATLFLVLLAGGCAIGLWLQNWLQEHHRSQETIEAVRMVVSMVVTFSALVLGLLVTSVKADFDDHSAIYRRYGIALIELNHRLVDYGAEADQIRQQLRSYTAAVVAATWPDETRPTGVYPTHLRTITETSDEAAELTVLMTKMDTEILNLSPADLVHQRIAGDLHADIRQLEAERSTLVERTNSRLSPIFIGVLMSWLFIIFVIFGIVSPRNGLTFCVVGLSALAVSSSLYLILDLDSSIGGFITISSKPIRDALWHMDHDLMS